MLYKCKASFTIPAQGVITNRFCDVDSVTFARCCLETSYNGPTSILFAIKCEIEVFQS